MYRFIIRRLMFSIPVLLGLVFTVFALMRAIPGGPFDFENDTSLPPSVIASLEKKYHIDEPFGRQFLRYVAGDIVDTGNLLDLGKGGLLRGDLGVAFRERGRTVNEIVAAAFPVSLQLGLMSFALAVMIGIPLGVIAALKRNTWIDYGATFVAITAVSLPALVLGPLLQWIFALKLGWLPVATWGASPPFILGFIPIPTLSFITHAILPVVTLGGVLAASIMRLTRASLLQVISEDYIRTARAKGLRETTIIARHALKNSIIPVVTVLGPMLALVVTGSFVIEQIFGIPGMGRYFVKSIGARDYSVIQGLTLIYAALLVGANLLVDISYAWLDPRIRYQ
jgi:oligopeptide transport system permease protein